MLDTYAFRAPCFHKEVDVSCQQPAAKGVGFVTMSIAILVAMVRRTGFLPSDRRPTILVK
jgi:hypothetical protein